MHSLDTNAADTGAELVALEDEKAPDQLLVDILTTRRCYTSAGDIQFRNWLYSHIEKMGVGLRLGALGNIIATVGNNRVLFSCHTDTVHSMSESNKPQDLNYDASFKHIFLANKEGSTCLGADDGAGVYIMLKMLEAKVPGTYIFHVGEEKGGVGAKAQLQADPGWFKRFDMSIAFDRPDDFEVICTQGGVQCASTTFGEALAKRLTEGGLKYSVSHRGVFTDNKIYNGVIRENVNLGVGYSAQHTKDEWLDYGHVEELVKLCCQLSWSTLPITRELPKPYIPPLPHNTSNLFGDHATKQQPFPPKKKKKKDSLFMEPESPLDTVMDMSVDDIHDLVEDDPYVAAHAIIALMVEVEGHKARVKALERLLS